MVESPLPLSAARRLALSDVREKNIGAIRADDGRLRARKEPP
jgi:hypothetical protein